MIAVIVSISICPKRTNSRLFQLFVLIARFGYTPHCMFVCPTRKLIVLHTNFGDRCVGFELWILTSDSVEDHMSDGNLALFAFSPDFTPQCTRKDVKIMIADCDLAWTHNRLDVSCAGLGPRGAHHCCSRHSEKEKSPFHFLLTVITKTTV